MWVYWPEGEPSPLQLQDTLPNVWKGTFGYEKSDIAKLNADGWFESSYAEPDAGYRITASHWEKNAGVVTEVIDTTEHIETADAAAYQAKVEAWAAAGVGTMVKLLRRRLISLGFSPPFTFDSVRAALLSRMVADDLTAAEEVDKFDALNLFTMLELQGLTEDDVRAVREYLESQGDV